MIAADVIGNLTYCDELRPECLTAPRSLYASMRDLGSIDAPDAMPAGGCCTIAAGKYEFAAQLLSLR